MKKKLNFSSTNEETDFDLKCTTYDEDDDEITDEIIDDEEYDDDDTKAVKSIDEMIFEDFEKNFDLEGLENDNDMQELIKTENEILNKNIPLEEAVKDFQNNIPEAFDHIYEHYKPKFERLARRQNNEELVSELSIALLKAVDTFQDNKGAKFNTYFWTCARNLLGALKTYNKAKKRTAENGIISIQQCYSNEKSEVQLEAFLEDEQNSKFQDRSIFKLLLESEIYPYLKDDERIACEMIQRGYTLEEIGEKLGGITAPAVHVKFRRLASKKNVGKKLRNMYSNDI